MTNQPDPIKDLNRAFAAALRPDPLPEPPEWLTPVQRTSWLLGAREGVALGRQLAAADLEAGWPLVARMEGRGDG